MERPVNGMFKQYSGSIHILWACCIVDIKNIRMFTGQDLHNNNNNNKIT